MKRYDWIIVGGSFAGLASARYLPKKGIVIDKHKIGEEQKSACGTLIDIPLAFNAEKSIEQIHNELILHLNKREVAFKTPYPFCTINYKKFCQKLANQGYFEFIQANVTRRENSLIITSKGDFESKILIDASGWNSVLTETPDKNSVNTGIEVEIPGKSKGLHFYYEGRKTKRVYWVFPSNKILRVGCGSYFGKQKIKEPLVYFLKNSNFSKHSSSYHGNCFPFKLRKPVVGNIFRVGDSAGHCLAFTGEGIRPALYFGTVLNRLLRKLISGDITLRYAQNIYSTHIRKKKKNFTLLTYFQYLFTPLPNRIIGQSEKFPEKLVSYLLQKYREFFYIKY